jgi:hypothetical protein
LSFGHLPSRYWNAQSEDFIFSQFKHLLGSTRITISLYAFSNFWKPSCCNIINCGRKWKETKKSQGFKYDNLSSKEEYEMLENLFQEKLLDEENKGYKTQNVVFERSEIILCLIKICLNCAKSQLNETTI